MSVINDMLRDLDKRQAPERAAMAALDVGRLIEPQKKINSKVILLIVLVVMALALLFKMLLVETTPPVVVPVVPPLALPLMDKPMQTVEAEVVPEPVVSEVGSEPASETASQPANQIAVEEPHETAQTPLQTEPESPAEATLPSTVETTPSTTVPEVTPAASATPTATAEASEENTEPIDLGRAVNEPALAVNEAANESRQTASVPLAKRPVVSPEYLDQQNAEAALALIQDDQTSLAYRQLYEFIAGHAYAQKSRALLAGYLMQENRLAEAGDVLVRASLEQDPDMRQLKARWLAASGEGAVAIYTLASNLPVLADYPEYFVLLASYYQQFGDPVKAAEIYSNLVQHDAKVANWWAGLGIALDSSRQFVTAATSYRQALQLPGLNPQFGEFIHNRLKTISQ